MLGRRAGTRRPDSGGDRILAPQAAPAAMPLPDGPLIGTPARLLQARDPPFPGTGAEHPRS